MNGLVGEQLWHDPWNCWYAEADESTKTTKEDKIQEVQCKQTFESVVFVSVVDMVNEASSVLTVHGFQQHNHHLVNTSRQTTSA